MLGDENGMIAKRRLPAVVRRIGRRQPHVDEVTPVLEDDVEPLSGQVFPFRGPQPESPAKLGAAEPVE
jgi:hypothetical protein